VGYGNNENYSTPFNDNVAPLGQTTTSDISFPFFNLDTPDYRENTFRTVFDLTVDANNFSLEYTGYYEPTLSGVYTFCQLSDDKSEIYVSNTGVNCGPVTSDQIPLSSTTLTAGSQYPICANISLVAGSLYPLRVTYGQIRGYSFSIITITPPGGVANTSYPGYFYPAGSSCAETSNAGPVTTSSLNTTTVPGPTPGTTTVPASGTVPAIIRVTDTPTCKLKCPSGSGTGLTVKIFPNTYFYGYGISNSADTPSFQGVTPVGRTTTSNLSIPYFGFSSTGTLRSVYNLRVDANNFSVEYTGYFEPRVTGVYQICQTADDIMRTFIDGAIGCNAIPSNATYLATDAYLTNSRTKCGNITLVSGYLYPLRGVFGQIGGPSSLTVTFQPPGGVAESSYPGYFYPAGSPCAGTNVGTVTLTTTGPTAGTSTVPASGTVPGTVVVTKLPPGTVTITTTGPVAGTSTVPASGTVSGTVVVTQLPPGTVTITTSGTQRGTSTVPASGTVSGTVIVTSCTIAQVTMSIVAVSATGTSTAFTVPPCATAMAFAIAGGDGGSPGSTDVNRGIGAAVGGLMNVTNGQTIRAIAGGQGTKDGAGGTSAYGSGGSGSLGGGAGGGSSALYLDNDLIVVAAGGGGGGLVQNNTIVGSNQRSFRLFGGQGYPGQDGIGVEIIDSAGNILSSVQGGRIGGQGGKYSGSYLRAANGNSATGAQGADGVAPVRPNTATYQEGGSGAGGGGFVGGGSGAVLYQEYLNGVEWASIVGSGASGTNFIDGRVRNSTSVPAGVGPGAILYVFG